MKDLREILDLLEILSDDESLKKVLDTESMVKEAMSRPCEIRVKKDSLSNTNIKVEGNRLSILLTLAGIEKTIFERFEVEPSTWELIKNVVGIKEANNE